MRDLIAGVSTGFVFGLGLCLSRMTNPAVVQGFLDLAGAWDPTLIFVMAGGVAVTFVGYRFVLRRKTPLWAPKFAVPAAGTIDAPLISGSAIFGIGWGLSGYCPGPAVVSLASGRRGVILFVVAMLAGMIAAKWFRMSRAVNMSHATR